MANLNIDSQHALVDGSLADPSIAAAGAMDPVQAAMIAQARDLGNTPVTANLGAVNADTANLGTLAGIYQGQLIAGPGALSQAAALQAQRNTNAVGGLASIAAGAQGEQAAGKVGQAEADNNAAGAIQYGNNAVMAQLQGYQQALQAHYDNLANHTQGTTLARNIGLAQQARALAIKGTQDDARTKEGEITLGQDKSMTAFTQGMVGAGLGAAGAGLSAAQSAFKTPAPTQLDQTIAANSGVANSLFNSTAAQQMNTLNQTNSLAQSVSQSVSPGSYDSPYAASGAPDASTWQYSSASSSFGLQSTYQTSLG